MSASGRLIAALLAVSVGCGAGAWRLQADATDTLVRALAVQRSEVPEAPGEPPSLEEYRQVIDALQRSISLRQGIDDVLSEVESAVLSLRESQGAASAVAVGAEGEVAEIGALLGGARESAGRSLERLGELGGSLETSVRLARLIAEELEELDRKLGPSAGGGG